MISGVALLLEARSQLHYVWYGRAVLDTRGSVPVNLDQAKTDRSTAVLFALMFCLIVGMLASAAFLPGYGMLVAVVVASAALGLLGSTASRAPSARSIWTSTELSSSKEGYDLLGVAESHLRSAAAIRALSGTALSTSGVLAATAIALDIFGPRVPTMGVLAYSGTSVIVAIAWFVYEYGFGLERAELNRALVARSRRSSPVTDTFPASTTSPGGVDDWLLQPPVPNRNAVAPHGASVGALQ